MRNRMVGRIAAFLLTVVFSVLSLIPWIQMSVRALVSTDGTIIMSNSTNTALITMQNGGTTNVNGKYVQNNNGEFIPVYCIEHGTSLNTGDIVHRTNLTPENGVIKQQSGNMKTLTQEEIDRISLIYLCGYNGVNGWGVPDNNIASNSSTPDNNGNFAKYVATQILIWEVTEGYEMGSNSRAVQHNIDIIRSRIEIYKAFLSNGLAPDNANDGRSVVEVGQLIPYSSEDAARANPLGYTSEGPEGTYHFAYSYPGWLNPAVGRIISSAGAQVVDYTNRDFTTHSRGADFLISHDASFSEFLSDSFGSVFLLKPAQIYLWVPESGNQLTISAEGTRCQGYLAFNTPDVTYVDSQVSAVLVKTDDNGNPARGASFAVYGSYAGGSLGNCLGNMTDADNDGRYEWNDGGILFGRQRTDNATAVSRTIYIAETSPATSVCLNGTWQDREFRLSDRIFQIDYSWIPAERSIRWSVTNVSNEDVIASATDSYSDGVSSISVRADIGGFINNIFGSVRVYKTDLATSLPLSEAVFSLRDEGGNEISTVTDDDGDGLYIMDGLPLGRYSITELQAPADHEVDPGIYYFEITSEEPDVIVDNSPLFGVDGYFANGPVVSTAARSAAGTGLLHISEDGKITDEISYYGLIPGIEYEIIGTATDAVTGAVLQTVTNRIIPTDVQGSAEIIFDSSYCIASDAVVIFEEIYRVDTGRRVGYHIDPTDAAQTITRARITTEMISDVTDEHMGANSDEIRLTDEVRYSGLIPGCEYVLSGIVIDADTSSVVSSVTVKSFVAADAEGVETINMSMRGLSGSSRLVAYERLYLVDGGNEYLIAQHCDIDDENQTVIIPDIDTYLHDASLPEHLRHTAYSETTVLRDIVKYEGLIPQEEYILQGRLVYQDSGEAVLDPRGQRIISQIVFVPEESDGEVILEFTGIDTTILHGRRITAFETLIYRDNEIVIHENLDDENQTLHAPDIYSELLDMATASHSVSYMTECHLTDRVTYSGLTPGERYIIFGTLMNRQTGETIVDAECCPITASAEFVCSDTGSGTAIVEFVIDSTRCAGYEIVAFEEIYYGDRRITLHNDINDENQTVYVPMLITSASVNGTKVYERTAEIDLVDRINYYGLTPGRTYILEGEVMRTDGTSFTVRGEGVTSRIEFEASQTDGSVDIHFSYPGSSVGRGEALVVYEHLYDSQSGVEVAHHADPKCMEQTVTAKTIPPSTGQEIVSIASIAGVLLSAAGISVFLIHRQNYSGKED